MRIEIINTGSELMLGNTLNTHQQWLCRELANLGELVAQQVCVTDSGEEIQRAVRESLTRRADLILVTGGLGPTSDDRTRDMIAQLFGRTLYEDPAIIEHIQSFFGKRKRTMPASTRVQAQVPQGARVINNEFGTAPGLILEENGSVLVMLPGPPRELRPMFSQQVVPWLRERFPPAQPYACTILKTTGLGESFLEERIAAPLAPLCEQGLELGYCARVGDVDLRLSARGARAEEIVRAAEELTRPLLREFIYGRGQESLEQTLIGELTRRGETLAVAESCTGGLIGHRLTNVPGASAVFRAALVTYSNESKQQFLNVNAETLAAHGAVSEPVAREMAEGARKVTSSDWAIAVTGIAGPDGGSAEKPVGTVFIARAGREGTMVRQSLNQYDRETFKFLTSQQALDWLRQGLNGH